MVILPLAGWLDCYGVFQLLPNRKVRRDPSAPLTNLFEFSNFVLIRSDRIADVEAACAKPPGSAR